MKLDKRDIIDQPSYEPLSNAELVAHIETYAGLIYDMPLAERGRWQGDIVGPARVLLARAEAAEAEVAQWRGFTDAIQKGLQAALARVAELEAQLAAQGWRPVTEKPEKPGWYVVYDSDGHVFYNAEIFPYRVARWTGKWDSAFNGLVDYWRPLPPAPQETE